ncbi:MAG: hypothetical protein LRY73_14960 [Bacillus sp. (in: Bacteria)]|nr:hypothetical protein [Bacillus sp. (in: firmicutes)]
MDKKKEIIRTPFVLLKDEYLVDEDKITMEAKGPMLPFRRGKNDGRM